MPMAIQKCHYQKFFQKCQLYICQATVEGRGGKGREGEGRGGKGTRLSFVLGYIYKSLFVCLNLHNSTVSTMYGCLYSFIKLFCIDNCFAYLYGVLTVCVR